MVARSDLRKEAYKYVLYILSKLPAQDSGENWLQFVPLEELRLVKEGIEDPSPVLVSLLKEMLQGAISDDVVDSHLVTPFEKHTGLE
jgi:hypothetical protein